MFARILIAILAFCALPATVSAVDLDESIQAYAERSRWSRVRGLRNTPQRLEYMKGLLTQAKRGRIKKGAGSGYSDGTRMVYGDAEAKKDGVSARTEGFNRRKKWLADHTPVESIFLAGQKYGKPTAGAFADFRDLRMEVFQGFSNRAALVEVPYNIYSQDLNPANGRYTWILDTSHELVLFKSGAVEGAADGSFITLNGVHWFSGTERYETKEGTYTVLVLEPVEISQDKQPLFTREGEMREWTDSKGKSLGRALVDYCDEKVLSLQYADDKTKRVRRSTLSDECELYLKKWFQHLENPHKRPGT